ncbi:MAG: DUF4173 domain-containing protein, partial [Chloroflexi bacterium]|nr:DUF4173 domain-containing protein [Chloroflexota bacterium]
MGYPVENLIRSIPMKTKPNILWIVVVVLGWSFDFLFWKKPAGLNFAIFATLCVGAAFYLLLSNGLRPRAATLILLPLFAFFAVVTFMRAESMTAFLAYSFTLLTMCLLAVTYLGGRWFQYAIADYFAKAVGLIGSMLARPVTFSLEVRRDQAEAGIKPSKTNVWPILRGVIIALPVVAIFASLLSSADVVFGQRLDDLIKLLRLENLPEYIFRFVYILVIGYALAGVILHAAFESKDEKLVGEDKPVIPPFFGFVESGIILGSVVILFAAFVAIQFQYFFGGNANINVEGYTYAEYARRGFGELVAVAFFALLMLFTLSAITRRETGRERRIYSGLGIALVVLLLVMLVSAYQRLGLYEAVYGFSRLRTYTHVFLAWIGLLLVATIVLEIMHKERMFAFAALVAAFGFAVSLPILNVDGFIVKQNIEREINKVAIDDKDRVPLDTQYFLTLSDDAVPVLVDYFNGKSLSDKAHEAIGASLACIRYQRGLDKRERPWQSFQFARFYADNALAP